MKFEARHSFPVQPDVLWANLMDPAMASRMTSLSQSSSEVVEERSEGTITWRTTRLTSSHPALAQVGKLLGAQSLTFDYETKADDAAHALEWSFVPPPGLAAKIAISGSFRVIAHPEGSERVANCSVEVKVPLVGGVLEKQIAGAIQTMYDKGAAVRRATFEKQAAGG